MNNTTFHPGVPLLPGNAHGGCTSAVVIPACDEAETLPACLDALAGQTDERGVSVTDQFEILLLLNNCGDDSASVAHAWKQQHTGIALHILQRQLHGEQANAGTARRLLMNTAWCRLASAPLAEAAILSTDADTKVHPQWVVRNMRALRHGADAVGGLISLDEEEVGALPRSAQRAYARDRRYQRLIAELEAHIDPQHGDPLPRHLDHFGASLACTPAVYARAGGLPVTPCLEDVGFVDRLRRIGARIRHDPSVKVFTSARLRGRAELGFGNQLRLWAEMQHSSDGQRVLSAAFLKHRFTKLAELRRFFRGEDRVAAAFTSAHRLHLFAARRNHRVEGQFLEEIDCDGLIMSLFEGVYETSICSAIQELTHMLAVVPGERNRVNQRLPQRPRVPFNSEFHTRSSRSSR